MSFFAALAGAALGVLAMPVQVKNTIRLSVALFKEDAEKSKFFDLFLESIDEKFRSEIFKIAEASDILGVNVETLRRKIRSNIIPVVEVEDSKKTVYQVTGDTIIKIAENDSQKNHIIEYYAFRNHEKSLIILAEMVVGHGASWPEETVRSIVQSISNVVLAGVKVDAELWPAAPIPYIEEPFLEIFEKAKKSSETGNTSQGSDLGNREILDPQTLISEDDASSRKKTRLEREFKKLQLARYKLEIADIDVSIAMIDVRLCEETDIQEQISLMEERKVLMQKKQIVYKQIEEEVANTWRDFPESE